MEQNKQEYIVFSVPTDITAEKFEFENPPLWMKCNVNKRSDSQ